MSTNGNSAGDIFSGCWFYVNPIKGKLNDQPNDRGSSCGSQIASPRIGPQNPDPNHWSDDFLTTGSMPPQKVAPSQISSNHLTSTFFQISHVTKAYPKRIDVWYMDILILSNLSWCFISSNRPRVVPLPKTNNSSPLKIGPNCPGRTHSFRESRSPSNKGIWRNFAPWELKNKSPNKGKYIIPGSPWPPFFICWLMNHHFL